MTNGQKQSRRTYGRNSDIWRIGKGIKDQTSAPNISKNHCKMHIYTHGQTNDTSERARQNRREQHSAKKGETTQKLQPAEPRAQVPKALREVGT